MVLSIITNGDKFWYKAINVLRFFRIPRAHRVLRHKVPKHHKRTWAHFKETCPHDCRWYGSTVFVDRKGLNDMMALVCEPTDKINFDKWLDHHLVAMTSTVPDPNNTCSLWLENLRLRREGDQLQVLNKGLQAAIDSVYDCIELLQESTKMTNNLYEAHIKEVEQVVLNQAAAADISKTPAAGVPEKAPLQTAV